MAKKKANTPKPAKAAGESAQSATNARAGAKHRKRLNRDNTKSRAEVRQQTTMRKGMPR
jgi:hypothetical protein